MQYCVMELDPGDGRRSWACMHAYTSTLCVVCLLVLAWMQCNEQTRASSCDISALMLHDIRAPQPEQNGPVSRPAG
jgi:hypothetical protein